MVRWSLLVAFTLLVTCGTVAFDDKIDGKLLIGKWEPDMAPPGLKISIEFQKDNKVVINVDFQGKMEKVEGSYKLENDQLSLTLTKGGQEKTQKAKIIKLTEKEVSIKDDEKGEVQTMKKVP